MRFSFLIRAIQLRFAGTHRVHAGLRHSHSSPNARPLANHAQADVFMPTSIAKAAAMTSSRLPNLGSMLAPSATIYSVANVTSRDTNRKLAGNFFASSHTSTVCFPALSSVEKIVSPSTCAPSTDRVDPIFISKWSTALNAVADRSLLVKASFPFPTQSGDRRIGHTPASSLWTSKSHP